MIFSPPKISCFMSLLILIVTSFGACAPWRLGCLFYTVSGVYFLDFSVSPFVNNIYLIVYSVARLQIYRGCMVHGLNITKVVKATDLSLASTYVSYIPFLWVSYTMSGPSFSCHTFQWMNGTFVC